MIGESIALEILQHPLRARPGWDEMSVANEYPIRPLRARPRWDEMSVKLKQRSSEKLLHFFWHGGCKKKTGTCYDLGSASGGISAR